MSAAVERILAAFARGGKAAANEQFRSECAGLRHCEAVVLSEEVMRRLPPVVQPGRVGS